MNIYEYLSGNIPGFDDEFFLHLDMATPRYAIRE